MPYVAPAFAIIHVQDPPSTMPSYRLKPVLHMAR